MYSMGLSTKNTYRANNVVLDQENSRGKKEGKYQEHDHLENSPICIHTPKVFDLHQHNIQLD